MDARTLIESKKPANPLNSDARGRISRINGTSVTVAPGETLRTVRVTPEKPKNLLNKITLHNPQKIKFKAETVRKSISIPAHVDQTVEFDSKSIQSQPIRTVTVDSMDIVPQKFHVSVNSHRNVQNIVKADNSDQTDQKINRQIDRLLKSYGHVDFSQQYSLSDRNDFEYKSPLQGVKVVVKNLPTIIMVENLYHIFSAFGAVRQATLNKNRAELIFSTMEEAMAVKSRYHQRTFHDCTLDVTLGEDERLSGDLEEDYDYPKCVSRKEDNPAPCYEKVIGFMKNGGMSSRSVSFTVYL